MSAAVADASGAHIPAAAPGVVGADAASSQPRMAVKDLPLVRQCQRLVLWESPQITGLTLLSLSLLTFLLQKGYTVLTLVSYLLTLQLLTCFVFINASRAILKLKGQDKPVASKAQSATLAAAAGGAFAQQPPADNSSASAAAAAAASQQPEYISESTLRSLVPLVASTLNVLFHSANRLIRCSSNAFTLQAIGVLCALSVLGRLADGDTCAALLALAALTIPKAYLLNKAAVDRALDKAKEAAEKARTSAGMQRAERGRWHVYSRIATGAWSALSAMTRRKRAKQAALRIRRGVPLCAFRFLTVRASCLLLPSLQPCVLLSCARCWRYSA